MRYGWIWHHSRQQISLLLVNLSFIGCVAYNLCFLCFAINALQVRFVLQESVAYCRLALKQIIKVHDWRVLYWAVEALSVLLIVFEDLIGLFQVMQIAFLGFALWRYLVQGRWWLDVVRVVKLHSLLNKPMRDRKDVVVKFVALWL